MPQPKVYTVQPRFVDPAAQGIGSWAWVDYLFNMGTGGGLPFYPSPARDLYLAEWWKQEPVLAGAIGVAVDKMASTDWLVKGGKLNANKAANMFHTAEGGEGWARFMSRCYLDFLVTNRGTMIELGRQNPRTNRGAVMGIQHLDSTRIINTGDLKKPWRYIPEASPSVDLWKENVLQLTALPAARDRHRGYGECAVERLRDSIGLMVGWLTHDRQMVGDLPPEAILIINGLSFEKMKESYDQYKLRREQVLRENGETNPVYAGFWMMGSDDPNTRVEASTVMLRRTDQYDRNSMYEWWVKLVALQLQLSVGELWLIMQTGNTKAVEGIHYEMERAKGVGRFARELEWQINWFVLPENVSFQFDAQDDQQDLTHADVLGKNVDNLAKLAKIGIETGEPLQTLDELKQRAVEWSILPPETTQEKVPTTLSSQLKEATQDLWVVRRDGSQLPRYAAVTGRVADKMQDLAALLDRAYSPFALSEVQKHQPGRHNQLTHGRKRRAVGELASSSSLVPGNDPSDRAVLGAIKSISPDGQLFVNEGHVLTNQALSESFSELGAISEQGWKDFFGAGGKLYAQRGNITEMNDNQHLKGKHPQGWPPRATWDTLFGGAAGGNVFIGAGGLVDRQMALHEVGHAFGEKFGAEKSASFKKAHAEALKAGNLYPYARDRGEAWAMAFASVQRSKQVGRVRALEERGLMDDKGFGVLFDAAEKEITAKGW